MSTQSLIIMALQGPLGIAVLLALGWILEKLGVIDILNKWK